MNDQMVLAQSWTPTLVGIGVGSVVAYYFYRKSIRRGILAVQWDGGRLVRRLHGDEITLSYRGKRIPAITSSEIVLWNAGTATIRGSDIVATDPLRFETEAEAEVLEARILKVVRSANDVAVTTAPDQRSVSIRFDFLDPGDGVRLSVLHTGQRIAPVVKGTIRGLPQGAAIWGRVPTRMPTRRELIKQRKRTHGEASVLEELAAVVIPLLPVGAKLLLLFALGVTLYGLLRSPLHAVLHSLFGQVPLVSGPLWALVGVGVLYATSPAMFLWTRRLRFPRALASESGEETEGSTTKA